MTLPLLPLAHRRTVALIAYSLFCVGYLSSGRMSPMTPVELPASALDSVIPFVSGTVWIYNSQFFLLAYSLFTCKTDESFSRLLYAMTLASLVAFTIFFLFPTYVARGGPVNNPLDAASFRILYEIDAPTNCFPSLHTALALLAALGGLAERSRARRLIGFAWATAIVIATQTTKQHFLVDAAGGLALGLVAHAWSVSVVKLRFKSRSARVPWSPESA